MGFLKGIVKGAANALGNVGKTLGKVADFLQSPLKAFTEPLKQMVGGFLDKLPFGLGNVFKPFVNTFLDNPLAFVGGGPLGGLGMLSQAAGSVRQLSDLATNVSGQLNQFADALPGPALGNVQNIFAHSHARLLGQSLLF
jgi:hypothetical protein